jgi:tellurite resistance protein TehA-like permease
MQAETQSVDQRAFKNVLPIAIGTLAWVATMALARFGPEALWDANPVLGWAAIALNVAVGIALIVIHARYLRQVDELQRKILVDGMALALGVGLVGGFAVGAASSAGLIDFDVNIAYLSTLMGVVYAIGAVIGTVRYR